MKRTMIVAALLTMPFHAPAADDLKVSQLEQDVRDLQRQVQALSRQIETQRVLAPGVPGAPAASRARETGPTPSAIPAWIDAVKWQRIQPGMGELDVIAVLGPPSSQREQSGGRVLLYAIEIGASGFLGGSVTMRDRAVVAVQKPTLQ